MDEHIVPQRNEVIDACTAAQVSIRNDPRWMRRIRDARILLLGHRKWAFNGRVLRVKSSDGSTTYTVTDRRCDCRGASFGHICKHIVAHRILVNAATEFTSKIEQVLPRATPAEIAIDAMNERALDADMAAAQEAVDELY